MRNGTARFYTAIGGILLFTLFLFGCATRVTFPEVSVKSVSQYEYCQEQEGLSLAIDPFLESDKVRTVFGIDLLAQGILPVLIIAENRHPRSGYLLEKQKFSILKKDDQDTESEVSAKNREPAMPYSSAALKRNEAAGVLSVLTLLSPLALPLFVTTVALGASSKDQIESVTAINANLSRKAFIDKTLFPGETHSGFVYFQMKDGSEIPNVSVIALRTTNMLLDKEVSFAFILHRRGGP